MYRALAEAYAEVGAYQDAVWAYRQAGPHAGEGKLPLVVVEQLANMEVRLACQRKHRRKPGWAPFHPWPEVAALRPDKLFAAAKSRLVKLTRFMPTAERYALLGSYWKKRATVSRVPKTDMHEARTAYGKAWELSSRGQPRVQSYHTCLWAQTARLAGAPPDTLKQTRAALDKLEEQLDKDTATRTKAQDFWADAARGDLAVSRLVVNSGGKAGRRATLEEAEKCYRAAFENRSSVRERDSVIDHLRDLAILMPARRRELEELIDRLTRPFED